MSGRREILDNTPIEVPVGFKKPMSLNERIKMLVRNEASQVAMENGYETFEEANDFDVDDDFFPTSKNELDELDDEIDSALKNKKFKQEIPKKVAKEWKESEERSVEDAKGKGPKAPAPEAEVEDEGEKQ